MTTSDFHAPHTPTSRPPHRDAPWADRRLLLFDLDDTLCDYAGARSVRLTHAFEMAFDAAEIPESERPHIDALLQESIHHHPHAADHFVELLAQYGVAQQHAENSTTWYRANPFHTLALFDGVRNILNTVRTMPNGDRRTIGIITNGPTDLQKEKIRILGIGPLIDFAIISEEFGAEKPDPSIYHEALRLGNGTPDDAVFIGDAPEFDIIGAQGVGIPTIWMNYNQMPWPETIPPPDREVRSLEEILPLLGHN